MSSDTLVYSAWSKDIDPLFAADKTLLYPTPTDIYADRRMSDSTTSESNSPATEPDLSALDPVRKPSLPGLDQLLEPVDPLYGRRPSMISDMSLSNRRSSHHTLSSYSFPAVSLDSVAPGHGGGAAATTPATSNNNSPYSSVAPADSPQFSAISWNSPSLSDMVSQQQQQHHHHHQHQHHQHQQQHHHHHHHHHHQSQSSSPSSPNSPIRGRSPAMTPPSSSASPQHARQQLNGVSASANTSATVGNANSSASVSPQTHPHSLSSSQQSPADSQPVRRPRGKLPKHTTDLLKEWLHAHSDHPYPSEDEKRDLCNRTKLSMSQVSNWMINARRRILAPASKSQSAASIPSDPYRSLPRQIGSVYTSHMYAPQPPLHHGVSSLLRRPPPSQDALRLYDPPYYPDPTAPRYQASSHPIFNQDRRLSYPNSLPAYTTDFQSSYPQFNPAPRDLTPRFFTSHTDSL